MDAFIARMPHNNADIKTTVAINDARNTDTDSDISSTAHAQKLQIAYDDYILTKDMPTSGGSNMLKGYMSLFDAHVVEQMHAAHFSVVGKVAAGELGCDFLGESSASGPQLDAEDKLIGATAQALASRACDVIIGLDANGSPRRSAALGHHLCLKPSYGTLSRFGTISLACSGECVSISARNTDNLKEVFQTLSQHDNKDGTSLPHAQCRKATQVHHEIKRVLVSETLLSKCDTAVQANFKTIINTLRNAGIECSAIPKNKVLKRPVSSTVWNILFAAELCNNVSRFDGVKYGHRCSDYLNIDELYTTSRSEAFGSVLKTIILYGSDVLSHQHYNTVYDKAMRVRRIIANTFAKLFEEADAIIMPTTSKSSYSMEDIQNNPYLAFEENAFTAPAHITGLPAIVSEGVQIMGPALSDAALIKLATLIEREA